MRSSAPPHVSWLVSSGQPHAGAAARGSRYRPHALHTLLQPASEWLRAICPELTSWASQQLGSMARQKKKEVYICVFMHIHVHACISIHLTQLQLNAFHLAASLYTYVHIIYVIFLMYICNYNIY